MQKVWRERISHASRPFGGGEAKEVSGSLLDGMMVNTRFSWAQPFRIFLVVVAVALFFGTLLPGRTVAAHGDAKAEGAQVFANSGCQHCHGQAGEGTKKGPSLQDVRKRMDEAQIKDQIKHGGKSMPAFADSLDDAQLEELVKFLRAKKWPPIPAPTAQ